MLRTVCRGVLWAVIAGLTLECCARLDDWISYGASPLGLYDPLVLDAFDNIGLHGKPHAHYLKWKLNSVGFRGPELDMTAMRILCVGSSETFGQYESEGHEWPRELERVLNKSAPAGVHYQLVNSGYSGETFPTSLERLAARLQLVRPKVVLFYPSLAHYLALPKEKYAGPPNRPKFRWRMQGRIENAMKAALPMWFQTWIRLRYIADAQGKQPQWADMPAELQERFGQDLETAIELSRAAGAEPVLITHANRFKDRVEPAERFMLISWNRFYPMLREDSFLRMEGSMNAVMKRVAKEQGVLLIDAAKAMPSGPGYFADFVHFNDRGSAAFSGIVAEKLAPQLMAQAQAALRSR